DWSSDVCSSDLAAKGAYLVEQRPLHAVVAGEPGVFDGLIEALVEFGRGLADLPLGCVGEAQQVDPFGGEGYAGDAAVGIDFGGGAVIGLGQAEPHHDPLRGETPVDARHAAHSPALQSHAALPQPRGYEGRGEPEHGLAEAGGV